MGRKSRVLKAAYIVICLIMGISLIGCGREEIEEKKVGTQRKSADTVERSNGQSAYSEVEYSEEDDFFADEEYSEKIQINVTDAQGFITAMYKAMSDEKTLYLISISENLTLKSSNLSFTLPRNLHITVQPGCNFIINCALYIDGAIYCKDGAEMTVLSSEEGAIWVQDQSKLYYNGMTLRTEEIPHTRDDYSTGYSLEFDKGNIDIHGGFYTALYVEGEDALDKLSIFWIHTNSRIYVNGLDAVAKIKGYGSFLNSGLDTELYEGEVICEVSDEADLYRYISLSESNPQATFIINMMDDIVLPDTTIGVYVPENFQLIITPGCKLTVESFLRYHGVLCCAVGDLCVAGGGALWFGDGGELAYGSSAICFKEKEHDDKSYSTGFSLSFPDGKIMYHGGYYTSMNIYSSVMTEDDLICEWCQDSAEVYLNGILLSE